MACNTNSKHEEEEEATNDYSSYWKSIPDPPTPVDNNIKVSTIMLRRRRMPFEMLLIQLLLPQQIIIIIQ